VLAATACQKDADRLQDHQQHLASLAASTTTIVEAWLDGRVQATYARRALDRTFRLVQQERADVAARPEWLRDPRTERLMDDADRSARAIARLEGDIGSGDRSATRRHLSEFSAALRGRT
jgi:hypothetical protein